VLGLDYVMAGYMHLAGGTVTCQMKQAPEINVSASDTTVKYDHTQTQAQLDNFHIDTVSPYGKSVRTHVGGLMSGEVSLTQNTKYMQEAYPVIDAGCLYVAQINVAIHINPTIFIARNYPENGCMFQAVKEHEKKHVAVDRMLVNKYSNLIAQALNTTLKKVGFAQGPFAIQQTPVIEAKVTTIINGVVKQYSDAMSEERRQRQQAVDNLQEYERVNNLCKGRN